MAVAASLVLSAFAAGVPTRAAEAAEPAPDETGCVAEIGRLLSEISARHWQPSVRESAKLAAGAAEPACTTAANVGAAARRVLGDLGDPALRVIGAAHFARTLEEWTGAPVTGVGLSEVLSIDIAETGGRLTVIAPVPGSPAASAGLRAGDVVISIDGVPTDRQGLTDSMRRLRPPRAGDSVLIEILRHDRAREVRLTAVELPPLAPLRGERHSRDGFTVLHLELRQFVPGAAAELRAAVEAADIDAVLLDLRGNPGGLVDELVAAAGVFLPPGAVVATVAGPDPATLRVADRGAEARLPLAVLIDAGSASAAEALAAALRAHGRARVYGERSFGKGLVHQTLPLPGGEVVMYPGGELETPDGRRILAGGVEPDVRTVNPVTRAAADLRRQRLAARPRVGRPLPAPASVADAPWPPPAR